MTVRRRGKNGPWMVDVQFEHADGTVERVRKVSPVQTSRGAEQYEREIRNALLRGPRRKEPEPEVARREAPTFASFATSFIENYARANNEESTVREKERVIRRVLLPAFGHLRLDAIRAREIEAYKARRLSSRTRKGAKPKPKTINEEVAILAKLLRVAQEWGELEVVPGIRRLKEQKPDFDFLDFAEAKRLIIAAKSQPDPWCAMIPVALWTGLRLGELRGLQWGDVDLVARKLRVRRSLDDRGKAKPPKGGQSRTVGLSRRATAILRGHQHLRGPWVFCMEDGSRLPRWACESKSEREEDDGPVARCCRKAGLRRVGWHVLRHTFASHLAMRGAHVTRIQREMGHSSLTMTMRYMHLSPEEGSNIADLLDVDDIDDVDEAAPQRHHDGTAAKQRG